MTSESENLLLEIKNIYSKQISETGLGIYSVPDWNRILQAFNIVEGKSILDVGIGNGALVNMLKKSNKFKVYVDGQELAIYKNEKEARKNAKQLISLLGEDFDEFVDSVLDEPKIEDTLGFSNGLKGNQTYNDVAEKIATIK